MTLLVPGHHLRSHRLSQRAQHSRGTRVEVGDDNNDEVEKVHIRGQYSVVHCTTLDWCTFFTIFSSQTSFLAALSQTKHPQNLYPFAPPGFLALAKFSNTIGPTS